MRHIFLTTLSLCATPAYALSVLSPDASFIDSHDKNGDSRVGRILVSDKTVETPALSDSRNRPTIPAALRSSGRLP